MPRNVRLETRGTAPSANSPSRLSLQRRLTSDASRLRCMLPQQKFSRSPADGQLVRATYDEGRVRSDEVASPYLFRMGALLIKRFNWKPSQGALHDVSRSNFKESGAGE